MLDFLTNVVSNHFVQTWLGSICVHLLSLYSDDFKGTKPFLQKMFPDKSSTFYFRVDFFILPLIGSFLAYIVLDPISLKTCVFAGLSWSGTIMALLKKEKKNNSLKG
jgi:hypothetical protein